MKGFHQIPVKLHGIEGRYASALFSAASKENVLPKIEQDLTALKSLLSKDAGVKQFLETPIYDRATKKRGLEVILGKGANQTTVNFFNLLAENGRLDHTSKIINSFQTLMTAFRGEVAVTVTSAKELDQKTLTKIKETLVKQKLAQEGKMLVTNKVDPKILGGLVIEVGDNTIDMSVSSKITKLNSLLTASV
ncbi:ATP synthase F0 subcomplex subunit OSCP atp5 [Boothiomyces sp. JEL0838]|nr:ATP synthase F0 subcomplex subunit OSCP atp5 [Boothiomyces sp. JEL0838]